MMVVVVIFSFIMAGVYGMTLLGDAYWQVNRVKIEIQQDLRKALDWMINDLRQAGDESIIDVPADDAWYPSITFKLPDSVVNGILVWETDTIRFARGGTDSSQIQRIKGTDTRILAQNVQSLQFRRLSAAPDTLEVAMTAQKNSTNGRPISYQLDFQIELRN